MPLVRFYLVTLPMFINKPYCNKSFDDMTSGLAGLYNLVVFLAETDRPMNPSVYHLEFLQCLLDIRLNYCDETLGKCCKISLNYLVNGSG